jgi:hypothetical protein
MVLAYCSASLICFLPFFRNFANACATVRQHETSAKMYIFQFDRVIERFRTCITLPSSAIICSPDKNMANENRYQTNDHHPPPPPPRPQHHASSIIQSAIECDLLGERNGLTARQRLDARPTHVGDNAHTTDRLRDNRQPTTKIESVQMTHKLRTLKRLTQESYFVVVVTQNS